jgi:hypothetical protein
MLEGIPIAALGPVGAVLVIVMFPYLQMARGKLVPRSALDDERNDTEQWRQAHGVSEAARAAMADQVHELLEHARTSDALLRSITEHTSRST